MKPIIKKLKIKKVDYKTLLWNKKIEWKYNKYLDKRIRIINAWKRTMYKRPRKLRREINTTTLELINRG